MRSAVTTLARHAEASDAELFTESRAEELANTITHGAGAVFGAVALVILVDAAAATGSTTATIGAGVYGGSLFACFLSSALYHGATRESAKRKLLACDHCAIFLVIAGTYTPLTLLVMRGAEGFIVLAAVWGLALIGISLRLAWFRYMHPLFIVLFLGMGWMGVVLAGTLSDRLGDEASQLMLVGCIAPSIGLVFYAWRTLRFHHALWHLASLAGAVIHFYVIYRYALPTVIDAYSGQLTLA